MMSNITKIWESVIDGRLTRRQPGIGQERFGSVLIDLEMASDSASARSFRDEGAPDTNEEAGIQAETNGLSPSP